MLKFKRKFRGLKVNDARSHERQKNCLIGFITGTLLRFHQTCTIIFQCSHEMLLQSYFGETIKLFTRSFLDDFCPVRERQQDIWLKYVFIRTPAVSTHILTSLLHPSINHFAFQKRYNVFRTFIKPRGTDPRIFQVKFKLTWISQLNCYAYQLSYNTECVLRHLLFKHFSCPR